MQKVGSWWRVIRWFFFLYPMFIVAFTFAFLIESYQVDFITLSSWPYLHDLLYKLAVSAVGSLALSIILVTLERKNLGSGNH